MMRSHIRLLPGHYIAENPFAIFHMHGKQELSYYEVQAGEEFTIPRHVNGFWHAAADDSDFDDFGPVERPKYRKLAKVSA